MPWLVASRGTQAQEMLQNRNGRGISDVELDLRGALQRGDRSLAKSLVHS